MIIAYQKEKIENAILFFAKEYKKKTRKYLNQTRLYKFLAFLDFGTIEEYGEPALGLTYKAMDKGPVPKEIYDDELYRKTESYEFFSKNDNYNTVEIITKKNKKPNLDYFSEYEIEKMNIIIEIYADKTINTNDISDASHEEIKAWKKAYNDEQNRIISYKDDVFENIDSKKEEELTKAEKRFIMIKSFERLKN